MKDKEFYIKQLTNKIANAFNTFYLWESLQKKEYENLWNKNRYFWGVISVSLQLSTFLLPSMIFEKLEKGKEVISIPFLLSFIPEGENKKKIEEKIKKQESILNKLWKWRCKIFVHQDVIVAGNTVDFCKEYPITKEEMEKILMSAQNILGMIKSTISGEGHSFIFRNFEEGAQIDAEQIMEAVRYFFQEKEKYLEKIIRGEIGVDEYRFPPLD